MCSSDLNWLCKHTQLSFDDVEGKIFYEVFPEQSLGRLKRAIDFALGGAGASLLSHSLNKAPLPLFDRSEQFIEQQIIVQPVLSHGENYCFIQINNVTSAIGRERALREQTKKMGQLANNIARDKERAQVTLDSIADAVITTDSQGLILSANPVAESLLGKTEESIISQLVSQVYQLENELTKQSCESAVMQCLQSLQVISNDADHVLISTKDRRIAVTDSVAPVVDAQGDLLGAVLVFRDVTEGRSLAADLSWQATHDPLTGLANRRAFEEQMKALLDKTRMYGVESYLLYLDLDQFKVVNDTCGHDAGDELLKQVAALLQESLRKADLLARLGGDEFGVLLEACDIDKAYIIANNLRQTVADFRFSWQLNSFKIGVSIGVAKVTGIEVKAAEILSAADAACYVSKDKGRNRIHFHEVGASDSSIHQKEMEWVARLQAAIDNDAFLLYAQRIQSISAIEPTKHYEILIRMQDERSVLIPPGAFLPAAERFGLIVSMDRWVIANVFNVLTQYMHDGGSLQGAVFSINLSGATLTDESLLLYITDLFEATPLLPQAICFEVTETAAIANLTQATRFLTCVREIGCKVALDDFGSGLSSFAYLKTLPIDYLKIDGQFVKDIAIDSVDRVFVEAINQIGHVMALETIAEYVEDQAILGILSVMGVDYAQGYGVHKPCPLKEILCN